MPVPIISDFEKERRENAIRSAGIDNPNHLSYNFRDPSRVYLRYRRASFIRNQVNESVSSEDTEEDDALEDEEDEKDEHDEDAFFKADEEDHHLDEEHSEEEENGDYDKNVYENGIGVPNQATKAQSVSSNIINEENSEFEPDCMELSDEGNDEDDDDYRDEEDISEDILDEVSKEHSMASEILNEDESEIRSDYMELDHDGILLEEREVRPRTGAI